MGKMNIKVGLTSLFGWLSILYATSTSALSLSQSPLFLVAGAEPNVMFVLDDSGSMNYEITPESYIEGVNIVQTTGTSRIPDPSNVYGMLTRSKLNATYYDPAKLYLPWVSSSDGVSLMANANTTCAAVSPGSSTSTGCLKLTTQVTLSSTRKCTSAGNCSNQNSANVKYYPATYFYFNGTVGGEWNSANYTKHEIISANAPFTGDGRDSSKRTDCNVVAGVVSCTFAQEIQNFANWYTYYHTRMLTAQAGIGRAFSQQKDDIRVGFGSINTTGSSIDGVSSDVIKTGVRVFDVERKKSFLTELYAEVPSGSTPLRKALDAIGTYYSRADNGGPWSKDPANRDSSPHAECRASYTFLMSDGYWNGDTPSSIGAQDSVDGSTLYNQGTTGPSSYKYVAGAPFSASQNDTLADVAMKYWKNDLRDNLRNRVKPNTVDPAFWQHMTTYTIGLGVVGTLGTINVADSILNSTSINWPTINTSVDDGKKIDDMIHAAVNGHGDFFSAGEPDVFAESLAGLLRDINQREANNAAAAAANSTNLNTGSVVYNALFNSGDWSGELKATEINPNGTFGNNLWTASIPSASSRKIYTFAGTSGVEFLWANLSTTQKNYLINGETDAAGQARLGWIRGVNDATTNSTYALRNREKILGDIVNSDPAYAGTENLRYDRLSSDLGGSSYTTYYNNKKKSRREMLYVGANDGMLHGFNAKLTGTPAAGAEVFTYIPNQVFSNFANLTSRLYGQDNQHLHHYMVDGPVYVTDAYIGGQWRSILVGSLGAGGKGIYVLDVTDPDTFSAANVLFELSEANYPQLGNITGLPIIAPGMDNRWKIYIGNGYNATSASPSKAYLGIIDIADEINKAANPTASSRTKFIEATSTAETGVENALAQPALLPDPTGRVVAAYAGDLRGNLWKFDLSGTTESSWKLAYSGVPLFVAKDSSNNRQPITASPTLGFNTELTPARVMAYFGTGRYVATSDNQVSSYIQTIYAIADKGAPITTGITTLHQKTIASSSTSVKRVIDGEVTSSGGNAVNWATADGWYMNFPANERITTKPLLLYDRLIFSTIIPSEDSCNSGGSGWLMELIAVGNTSLTYHLLGDNGNTYSDVAIFGQLTSLEGTLNRGNQTSSSGSSGSSASSSSSGNECGAGASGTSGTIAVVGIRSNGEQVSTTGGRPCELFNRQSWRQLE